MTADELAERLRSSRPSCIREFAATATVLPEKWDDNPKSVWKLGCRCGEARGSLLGFSLKDYNTAYDGPEIFISPLAFQCSSCKSITELLDTDRHGYHVEIDIRAGVEVMPVKLRGEGSRRIFPCPQCGRDVFRIIVAFVFWNVDELAEEFEGEWEDLFNVFLCYCICEGCGYTSMPTDFGKL